MDAGHSASNLWKSSLDNMNRPMPTSYATNYGNNGLMLEELSEDSLLGFARRPRADTMPSRSNSMYSTLRSAPTPASNMGPPTSGSLAGKPPLQPIANRLRSGSATLPPSSLSKAFGTSLFTAASWAAVERIGDGNSGVLSPATPNDMMNDDVARTLGVLGLDDHTARNHGADRPGLQPPLDFQFSGGPDGAGMGMGMGEQHAQRMRSFSTSTPVARIQVGGGGSGMGAGGGMYTSSPDGYGPVDNINASGFFAGGVHQFQQQQQQQKQSQQHMLRPRAISVGMLDQPGADPYLSHPSRLVAERDLMTAGVYAPQHHSSASQSFHRTSLHSHQESSNESDLSGSGLLNLFVNGGVGMVDVSGGIQTPHQHHMSSAATTTSDVFTSPSPPVTNPSLNLNSMTDFTFAPLSPPPVSPPSQIPTRSLWIGNLDPTLSIADLHQLFASIGTVEGVKLLPEKECGFVNFSTVEEALRARDEIMLRMGSRIGHCIVRVGFGKATESSSPTGIGPSVNGSVNGESSQPTRALWIGNIPATTPPELLREVFSAFGTVESARVLTHKNCGFVNFATVEEAVVARKMMMGQDLFGVSGTVLRLGFAKEPPKAEEGANGNGGGVNGIGINGGSKVLSRTVKAEDYHAELVRTLMGQGPEVLRKERAEMLAELVGEAKNEMAEGSGEGSVEYISTIPPALESKRRLEAGRLRELRKHLESVGTEEAEVVAQECLDEIVELCSDYIGNTVVQRLFERCGEEMRSRMLEMIAPHLASIGVHKNGTWAAQKIMGECQHPDQIALICARLAPFIPALLLDQFGNYVVQCVLPYGSTRNQFVFDAMAECLWEIAQGRFGARAMRACLESPHANKRQQRQVAVAIAQCAPLLATNPNGTLLLTWLLDTSGLPRRYGLLAPRLVPHMGPLCVHKLASLTVLKLVNQHVEPKPREQVLQELLGNPNVLEEVLSEPLLGAGVIVQVKQSCGEKEEEKKWICSAVEQVLQKMGVVQAPAYRKLAEEIGLEVPDSAPTSISNSNSGGGSGGGGGMGANSYFPSAALGHLSELNNNNSVYKENGII
ncbi:uncharacterized protein VTP21DRAFT_9958 [Calcarisporiella thermophila]|uniref:uncharacterized protein n=1 Tax=Calcarisporiella thermophila TaxID=911321 RepID=UPI003742DEBE